MYRLSSYSIFSEPLENGGYVILNGLTGAMDFMTNETALDLIKYQFKPNLPNNLLDKDSFSEFIERGHITNLSHDDEREQMRSTSKLLSEIEKETPCFVIVPNLDCNYRCTYCFERPLQNKISFTNKDITTNFNTVVSDQQIDSIFKTIEFIKSKPKTKPLDQIILYGGEPLSKENKDVVYKIVNHRSAREFTFVAITNGHDLDHFFPLLRKDKINQIQVCIDGPKRIHDSRRISKTGESSYDKIMKHLQVLVSKEISINIRVHIDQSNIGYFNELINIFDSKGLLNNKSIIIYVSLIYSKTPEGRVTTKVDILEIINNLNNSISKYNNIFIGSTQTNANIFISDALNKWKPYRLRSYYCLANSGMYVFLPDGNINACWESIGKDCSKIGSYFPSDKPNFNKMALEKWFNRSVNHIDECLDCPYCLVCAGGCAQYAEYNTGSLYKPFCDNFDLVFPHVLAKTCEDFISN